MPHCDKKTISFILTNRCNMACRYCYASRETNYQTLDLNFAKKAIEEYVGPDSRYGLKQIRFFAGGEPTTEFELMKTILQMSRERCPDLLAELQTNGFFSLERAKWLGDNMDLIWISMDLFPEANDVYRVTKTGKPSSPIIERNLKYYRDNPKKALVGVRGTITNDNLYRQKEGIDYLYSLGIRDIWVDPIFPPVETEEERMYEPIDTMEFAKEFIKAREYAKTLGVFYESNYTSSFDGECVINCRSCIPLPHLTTDGYVSACEMALYGENAGHMDPFIYGRYDKESGSIEYDDRKIEILRNRVLQNMPDECMLCVARNHCAGYCPGEVLNETGSLFLIKRESCKPIRYLYMTIGDDYQHVYKNRHP